MNSSITLKNGITYEVDWFGEADKILWISGLKMGMLEAATLFSDASNTEAIAGSYDAKFEGYTKLINLADNLNGSVKIALRKNTN